jgi:hypothetical protein
MSEYPVGTVAMATVRGVEGVRIFLDGAGAGWTSAIAALIREQIAPPRIEEPGPWGVVEAGPSQRRTQWVHYWGAGDRARWRNLSSGQETSTWEDIIEPTLIRPGIEATR